MSTMVITDVRPDEFRAARSRQAHVEQRSHVHLTRRGKVVLVLAALAILLMVGIFAGAGSVATQDSGGPTSTTIVKVEPGQTLWGLASAATPSGGDVRDTMDAIKRLNALDSAALAAGQRLRVPLPVE